MRTLKSLAFHFDGSSLQILDQTLLPHKTKWMDATDPATMAEAIQKLRIRGAPLIGVAAVVCLARQAELGRSEPDLRKLSEMLRATRPTAVNLMKAIDRMWSFEKFSVEKFVQTAESIFLQDVELCNRIAQNGSQLIKTGDQVLTHCNTGGLATAGVGTAIGILRHAHCVQKKNIHVYVDETRPLLQGGRLTTWEMQALNIPYTLLCDNMAAILMREKKVNSVIVGADRIVANGDFANKVGTYGLAVLAKHHGVPFYVAAPVTTVDSGTLRGRDIPIEERPASEVRGVHGSWGEVLWSPHDSVVFNPAFDVTPADLVTAWILDTGVYDQGAVQAGCFRS